MENKVAAVRSAAVEVLGQLYNQIGPKLLSIAFTDEMKPALKALIEAEFTKVGYDPAAKAKRGKFSSWFSGAFYLLISTRWRSRNIA